MASKANKSTKKSRLSKKGAKQSGKRTRQAKSQGLKQSKKNKSASKKKPSGGRKSKAESTSGMHVSVTIPSHGLLPVMERPKDKMMSRQKHSSKPFDPRKGEWVITIEDPTEYDKDLRVIDLYGLEQRRRRRTAMRGGTDLSSGTDDLTAYGETATPDPLLTGYLAIGYQPLIDLWNAIVDQTAPSKAVYEERVAAALFTFCRQSNYLSWEQLWPRISEDPSVPGPAQPIVRMDKIAEGISHCVVLSLVLYIYRLNNLQPLYSNVLGKKF